ncbi:MAG: beta-lactamase family protein [Oxalobacter sp.]|nr:beta-lactamase family protein [Oxalobacter sp.]
MLTELTQKIDQTIADNLENQMTSGIVTLVYLEGKPVYAKAAGMADIESGIPMQENTLFRFASISKAFTSLAVAALIGQEKIQLDDSVTTWLPDFLPKLPDGSTPTITIRHLLSHMSGLDYRWAQKEDGPYATAGVTDGLDITGISLEENIRRIASAPLAFAPGSSWLYSLAPDVLGAVIAKAHGTDFPTAMQQLVLEPLGITDTAFYVPPEQKERVAAAYYLDDAKKLTRMADDQFLTSPDDRYFHFSPERVFKAEEYPSGGVGLVGTAADLMKIVEVIRTGDAPFTSKDLILQMSENQLHGIEARPGMGFGLGWGILVDPVRAENTPQTIGTRMWGGVYGSKWFTDPAKALSVVSMTTTALDEVVSVAIRNALYSALA